MSVLNMPKDIGAPIRGWKGVPSMVGVLSGEYYQLLWRRASRFLVRARRDLGEGDYDGACFNSEQAVQLAVKALLYKFFGETPRIHGSKALLARLRNLFMDAGEGSVAELLSSLISSYRSQLDLLEESYIMARYGFLEYGEKQGRLCLETAERILEVLMEVEKRMG